MTDDAGIMARVLAREPGAFAEMDAAYRVLMCWRIKSYSRVNDLLLDHDDVDAVADDWLAWLWDHAGAWRPDGGSTPVNWSRGRVSTLARAHLWGISVKASTLTGVGDPREQSVGQHYDRGDTALEMLRRLAATDERVALALELLEEAVPEVKLDLLLEAMICPRGAALLASKNLAAVRRQRARHQLVLRERIASDERFAPLAGAFAAG